MSISTHSYIVHAMGLFNYLSNRKQFAVVGGKQSPTLATSLSRVPQGSVLGPLLFLITLMMLQMPSLLLA